MSQEQIQDANATCKVKLYTNFYQNNVLEIVFENLQLSLSNVLHKR